MNGNVLVCALFSPKLAHGTYCLCSITQLLRLLEIVYMCSRVNAMVTLNYKLLLRYKTNKYITYFFQ